MWVGFKRGEVIKSIWRWKNLPNFISCIRIVLAASFPFVDSQWHLLIVFIAMLSEALDGMVARLFGWTSRMGEILDPVADKVFFLSVCLTWYFTDILSVKTWLLLSTRDIGVFLTPFVLTLFGKVKRARLLQARKLGKITTVLQYASLFSILIYNFVPPSLLFLTATLGVLASIHYFFLATRFYTR